MSDNQSDGQADFNQLFLHLLQNALFRCKRWFLNLHSRIKMHCRQPLGQGQNTQCKKRLMIFLTPIPKIPKEGWKIVTRSVLSLFSHIVCDPVIETNITKRNLLVIWFRSRFSDPIAIVQCASFRVIRCIQKCLLFQNKIIIPDQTCQNLTRLVSKP